MGGERCVGDPGYQAEEPLCRWRREWPHCRDLLQTRHEEAGSSEETVMLETEAARESEPNTRRTDAVNDAAHVHRSRAGL